MNYRASQILSAESITTAATKTIDINLADPISRICVVVELTNSSWTPVGHPATAISKIEVVDGSDVIFSANGRQAQAAAFYGSKAYDHNELNYDDNGICRAAMSIYFGRYLWDEELGLDPKQFNNLQLKITHNYLLGGGTPDAATLAVLADVFDQKQPSFRGYMLQKEHYSYTPVAGAAEYIDLPTDHPMRMILVGNTNDNEETVVQIESVKLTEEHDKRVIADMALRDLMRLMMQQYPTTYDLFSGRVIAASRNFWFGHNHDLRVNILEQTGIDSYMWKNWSGGLKQNFDAGVEMYFAGEAGGHAIHGGVPILCGKPDMIEDWWDVTQLGNVRLKLTPRAASCDTNFNNWVLTSQMRPY